MERFEQMSVNTMELRPDVITHWVNAAAQRQRPSMQIAATDARRTAIVNEPSAFNGVDESARKTYRRQF